jgi:hypothetical protein
MLCCVTFLCVVLCCVALCCVVFFFLRSLVVFGSSSVVMRCVALGGVVYLAVFSCGVVLCGVETWCIASCRVVLSSDVLTKKAQNRRHGEYTPRPRARER